MGIIFIISLLLIYFSKKMSNPNSDYLGLSANMFVLVCIIYIFAALTFFQCLLYQALQNIYLYGIKENQCLKNKINSLQKKF